MLFYCKCEIPAFIPSRTVYKLVIDVKGKLCYNNNVALHTSQAT